MQTVPKKVGNALAYNLHDWKIREAKEDITDILGDTDKGSTTVKKILKERKCHVQIKRRNKERKKKT